MEKLSLSYVYFEKLKGLFNAKIEFSDTLTAIMGVNGSGKTTVIHALACTYQPDGNGEDHRFPEFFIPNTDALWNGSKFVVVNRVSENIADLKERTYTKKSDRWCPRYDSRPKRNVYYLGIDSCLPDVEKKTAVSRINYKTTVLSDAQAKKILQYSAAVLNKDYKELLDNIHVNKHFIGVELTGGLRYSSLSMGSGEQRVIKTIELLLRAEQYSLILIDEIDLLLHVSALRRLIETIYSIAQKRKLQIVFTTHSMEMMSLKKYVKIQYISNVIESRQTHIYDDITADFVYSMTGYNFKTHSIYVEDDLAKTIINEVLRQKNIKSHVDVFTYGAIENAFTLASAFVITGQTSANKLIVLDGDKYRTAEEKEKQIGKKLTGTEYDSDSKRTEAKKFITQFKLSEGMQPERFLHSLITDSFSNESEIFKAANEIKAVLDSHEWIYNICKKLDEDEESVVRTIVTQVYDNPQFANYIGNIVNWLDKSFGENENG